MKINVLFFAYLKDVVGKSKAQFEVENSLDVAGLKLKLVEMYPQLEEKIPNVIVSINQDFAFDADIIEDGAEIALFPPVSGGSDFPTVLMVTTEELDLNELLAKVTLPTTGAAGIFTGIVRGETSRGQQRKTEALEYEAYGNMAKTKMAQIADEIRIKWQAVEGIVIVQRIGLLKAGTPTVTIICTASHRDTGVFEAARYGIDRLKEIVPVWKKEINTKDEEWIEGKYYPDKGD
ncbi:MAG: molybdenum cofactor biosynthesis protein MoaE [Anaerolineaceae bacterium]